MSVIKTRNNSIDIFRGIAMLLVVMGHTLAESTVDYEKTIFFNIIWTLQMPLFMIISGYVTKYSSKINNFNDLIAFVKKRSLSYLLPWFVWTILVRGIVFNNKSFLNFGYLLWHMDTGYWFLISLWMICMIYGLAQYFCNKLNKNYSTILGIALVIIFCGLLSCPLIIIGHFAGMSFLGIKYSLYYLIFYLLGFSYSRIQDLYEEKKWFVQICEISVFLCFLAYGFILSRYNVALLTDSIPNILLRVMSSITGCIALFGIGNKIINRRQISGGGGIAWIGIHSIEIYLAHYLVLNPIKDTLYQIQEMRGITLFLANLILTFVFTIIITISININVYSRKILLGK